MAMTADRIPQTHSILDGRPKRMFIGGKWVEAASGKTFDSINPAPGEVLAQVAEGDAEDIRRAVAAARRAFNGPWSKWKPYERQQVLLKLAKGIRAGSVWVNLLPGHGSGGTLRWVQSVGTR